MTQASEVIVCRYRNLVRVCLVLTVQPRNVFPQVNVSRTYISATPRGDSLNNQTTSTNVRQLRIDEKLFPDFE